MCSAGVSGPSAGRPASRKNTKGGGSVTGRPPRPLFVLGASAIVFLYLGREREGGEETHLFISPLIFHSSARDSCEEKCVFFTLDLTLEKYSLKLCVCVWRDSAQMKISSSKAHRIAADHMLFSDIYYYNI